VLFASAGNFGLSFILELVGTVLVVLVIWRYVVPPLRTMMARRLATIESELEAGDRARAAAGELVSARRAALEEAKAEAARILEQAQRAAETLVADGTRAAEEEYQRALVRAENEVESFRTRLRAEVMDEAGSVVVAAAERVVEAILDQPRHHRLIGEAIGATETEVGA